MSNSDNPKKGADFQKEVQKYFINKYGPGFDLEKKIPIGEPPKDHKFDIVNWNGDITHACSWNINALKNHYLMQQQCHSV